MEEILDDCNDLENECKKVQKENQRLLEKGNDEKINNLGNELEDLANLDKEA